MSRNADAYDVVIVGSGVGGLTTALVCAQQGLSILLLEATKFVGGSTAWAAGALWIPGNPFMSAFGPEDSFARAEEYLRAALGAFFDEQRVRAYIETAPKLISHLIGTGAARFAGVPLPDYFPELPGAAIGRSIITEPFDGRALGGWLRKVRRPLPAFSLFGTMQADMRDAPQLERAFETMDGAPSLRRGACFVSPGSVRRSGRAPCSAIGQRCA